MLPGSTYLGSNSGLTGLIFCIWNLSPYGFGSVQILSQECLLSVPNLLSDSFNICFLHQYSFFSSLYLLFLRTLTPFVSHCSISFKSDFVIKLAIYFSLHPFSWPLAKSPSANTELCVPHCHLLAKNSKPSTYMAFPFPSFLLFFLPSLLPLFLSLSFFPCKYLFFLYKSF